MNWNFYLKSFQSYLKIERGLSQNTIDNYTFDIERLCLFLEVNAIDVSPIKITEETIDHIAHLSRLRFEGDAKVAIRQDLENIIGFMGKLEDYLMGKEIGKGSYASVKQAIHKQSNQKL